MKNSLSALLPITSADTVILDTDICTDCDDCGALAVMFHYCRNQNIKIGAVINNIDNLHGCGAIDAIASYYGFQVPIGMTTDKGFLADAESRYSRQLSEQFSENFRSGTLNVHAALDLYRDVLKNAADKSVVIITVGFLNTAAEILAAEPALFAAKVRCVVSMAGNFADLTHREYNIAMQTPAAQAFYNTCPVPVFFHGFEIGISFQTGFSAIDPKNPVSVAYELHNHGHNASFDPAAVDFAFRGVCEDWALSEPLSVHVNDDATISFQPDADGMQTYVKFADEEACERVRLRLDEIYSAPATENSSNHRNEKQTNNKMKLWKRILIGITGTILAVVLILVITVYAVWHNEISAVASMKLVRERNPRHLDGAVYTMTVKGDFYLDDFVEQGGVKNDTELIDFITAKITKGLIDIVIKNPKIGCSSFTAWSESGDALFGRNYDFPKTNTCIVFTEKNDGRHATISTVDLQFLGIDVNKNVEGLMDKISCLAAVYAPIDGINDAGVACGIYMSNQGRAKTVPTDQNTDKPDVTSTTLLRLILDYADNVEEAVEIASAYDLHDSAKTSFHYMVADSSGKSAILEWVYGTDATDNDGQKRELKVTYNDADSHIGEMEASTDYQVITNFIIQPGYYDESPEKDKKGYDRYERIYEELNKTNGIVKDEQAAMDILSIVGRRTWNNDGNGCTVHSVVFNLTDKTVLWIPNENYDDPDAVFKFSFED